MILRPFIAGGYTTLIESAPGVGKSCFTTALCAQIVGSNASFIKERCITRCTPPSERGYKVVYLTFDADGTAAIQDHRNDFAGDLGASEINFIQKDQSGDENNYSKPENYGPFVSLLNNIRDKEGIPGQAIDVLVIDTLLEFTHGAVRNSHLFFQKLVKEYPNMAIVLIHHLNKADETYGGVKSTMALRVILKIYRTEEQLKAVEGRKPILADPFTFSVEKFNTNKILDIIRNHQSVVIDTALDFLPKFPSKFTHSGIPAPSLTIFLHKPTCKSRLRLNIARKKLVANDYGEEMGKKYKI